MRSDGVRGGAGPPCEACGRGAAFAGGLFAARLAMVFPGLRRTLSEAAAGAARSAVSGGNSRTRHVQNRRCNWAAARYSPRRFRPPAIGKQTRRAQAKQKKPDQPLPEDRATKRTDDVRDARFCPGQPSLGGDSMLMQLLPFVLIFVIMYFLILRPQQKRAKEHQELVKNLRRGDTVITSGGLVGKVTKVVDDEQIEVEIADGVRVRQVRSMVTGVRAKGEPVKDEAAKDESASFSARLSAIGARSGTVSDRCFVHLALEGGRDPAHGAGGVPVRRSEFLPGKDGAELAEMGAAPHRARPRPAGRLAHPARGRRRRRAPAEARDAARRHPQGAARRAHQSLRRAGDPRQHRRGAGARGRRAAGADQAARALAAARRLPRLDRRSARSTSSMPAAA